MIMIVLGVTGGTGTGKSTVCKMLKDKGAKVIDADKIAKKAQRKGTPAYERIVEHFGKGILQENGEIDRAALGKIVFRDYREMLKVKMYREEGESLVVLDVPIPIEEGFFDTANSIWTVSANNDIRVERLMERMNISESEAEVRINAQMSNREYEEIADTVIQNEGSEEELKKLVDYEYMRLMAGL